MHRALLAVVTASGPSDKTRRHSLRKLRRGERRVSSPVPTANISGKLECYSFRLSQVAWLSMELTKPQPLPAIAGATLSDSNCVPQGYAATKIPAVNDSNDSGKATPPIASSSNVSNITGQGSSLRPAQLSHSQCLIRSQLGLRLRD